MPELFVPADLFPALADCTAFLFTDVTHVPVEVPSELETDDRDRIILDIPMRGYPFGPPTDPAGTEGPDRLVADAFGVQLFGQGGNDCLFGGSGADSLDGGDGDDFLLGWAGDNHLAGGPGFDVAVYTSLSSSAFSTHGIDADLSTGQVFHSLFTNLDGQVMPAATDTVEGVEGVLGTILSDSIIGDPADNLLVGGPGPDALAGQEGHDVLFGGDGGDILLGGSDTDELWGGAGADQFGVGDMNATDVIFDFQLFEDTLLFPEGFDTSNVTIENATVELPPEAFSPGSHSGAAVGVGETALALLVGVDAAELGGVDLF
jgi:Ca2+-binding RTX toxin-like protein